MKEESQQRGSVSVCLAQPKQEKASLTQSLSPGNGWTTGITVEKLHAAKDKITQLMKKAKKAKKAKMESERAESQSLFPGQYVFAFTTITQDQSKTSSFQLDQSVIKSADLSVQPAFSQNWDQRWLIFAVDCSQAASGSWVANALFASSAQGSARGR